MKKSTSHEDIQKVFDCYCKKILKHEAINIQKQYQRLNNMQVSFSELSPEQLAELATYDEYSTDYDTYKVMILSILVYTFFSRMFDLMLPPVAKHSIVVA